MIRIGVAACVLFLVASAGRSVSAAPDGAAAAVELKVISSAGAPLTGARVQVYVWPSDPPSAIGSSFSLWPVAVGSTDDDGSFAASLSGTTLAGVSGGDAGAGAFNVMVLAVAPGEQAVWHGVVRPGATTTATARAVVVDPAPTASAIGEGIEPLSVRVVDEGYRYIRILAYNCAKGMSCDLTFTYTEDKSRETRAEIAYTYGGTWSAGGMRLEERDRSVTTHWKKSGNYHRYVWANYKWLKYAYSCAHCDPWWEWHLDHFQGTIGDYNPNTNASGRVIGTVSYSPPPLDTDINHQVALTGDNSPWTRDTGQYKTYGFTLSFADYLRLQSKATYGSITSMTWTRTSGCSGKRILWGDGADPVDAPIVQASCVT